VWRVIPLLGLNRKTDGLVASSSTRVMVAQRFILQRPLCILSSRRSFQHKQLICGPNLGRFCESLSTNMRRCKRDRRVQPWGAVKGPVSNDHRGLVIGKGGPALVLLHSQQFFTLCGCQVQIESLGGEFWHLDRSLMSPGETSSK
jgi:hypothetical protein